MSLKLSELKAGDKIVADNGFTCLPGGAVCEVQSDAHGLYVKCKEGERHLSGQLGDNDEVVGFSQAGE